MADICVLGSSGFVGRAFVRYCRENNKTIRSIPDIRNLSDQLLDESLSGCSTIVNFIGRFDPPFTSQITSNVLVLEKICSSAVRVGVGRLIHLSAAAVYGIKMTENIPDENVLPEPDTEYSLSKLMGEEVLRYFSKKHGLSYVILRPTNIYGEDSEHGVTYSFLSSINKIGKVVIHGDGKQIRDFIYVDDLILMLEVILNRKNVKNEVFNVGSGYPVTLLELAEIFKSVKNVEIPIIFKSADQSVVRNLHVSIEKAKNELKWKPAIPLKDGISRMIK